MTIQQYPLQVSVRKEAMKAQSRVSHESVHSLVLATDSQDYYSNGRVLVKKIHSNLFGMLVELLICDMIYMHIRFYGCFLVCQRPKRRQN